MINATGVIIHTNLGRAPLARAAVDRIGAVTTGYSTLEYDLDTGGRGSRTAHAEGLIRRLTGAEAAVVVNNNAAAVLLLLSALAAGREVIVSRGELVEIGGEFRIPDILRQSGALLREVGTTNRTRAEDYAAAVNPNTALILRVHPSNFTIAGFAERPDLQAVVQVGRRLAIPVVEDLGSGNLRSAGGSAAPTHREPTVQESIRTGVAACCFSGDKLLGGPQAGIIAGSREAVEAASRHPLMRAVRADKIAFAALEATLAEHLAGRAAETIPVARMIAADPAQLANRAAAIARSVEAQAPAIVLTITSGQSAIGGGTTPDVSLPSCVLDVEFAGRSARSIAAALRAWDPPVIGRIEHDRVRLDLRTLMPEQDAVLVEALSRLGS